MVTCAEAIIDISRCRSSQHRNFCYTETLGVTLDPLKDEVTGSYVTCDAVTKTGCNPGYDCGFITPELGPDKRGFCCPELGKRIIFY